MIRIKIPNEFGGGHVTIASEPESTISEVKARVVNQLKTKKFAGNATNIDSQNFALVDEAGKIKAGKIGLFKSLKFSLVNIDTLKAQEIVLTIYCNLPKFTVDEKEFKTTLKFDFSVNIDTVVKQVLENINKKRGHNANPENYSLSTYKNSPPIPKSYLVGNMIPQNGGDFHLVQLNEEAEKKITPLSSNSHELKKRMRVRKKTTRDLNIEILDYIVDEKKVAKYIVKSTWASGLFKSVCYRYSEFQKLHEQLQKECNNLPSFPPKNRLAQDKLSDDFLLKRKVLLERYLRDLVLIPRMNFNKNLIKWLGYDDYLDAQTASLGEMPQNQRPPKIQFEIFSSRSGQSVEAVSVDDLVKLDDFSPSSILDKLASRYKHGKIYTHIGTILVSVNPYRILPLYTVKILDQYTAYGMGRGISLKLAPHVFGTTALAYQGLLDENKDQSMIISGVSGAGKTEMTKLILQYLSSIGESRSDVHSLSIKEAILFSNPLLEAFGNAKTPNNNNSSRFGKWITLHFNEEDGSLLGAKIQNYLLEKSRVVAHGAEERNYHIFYQLCKASSQTEKEELCLEEAKYYQYTNQGCIAENIDDGNNYETTVSAMYKLNFTNKDIFNIKKIIASVLHLGNIQIIPDTEYTDNASIVDEKELQIISRLIDVPAETIKTTIISRAFKIYNETTTKFLSPQQAIQARDALAKEIYFRLFNWLVKKINMVLFSESNSCTIGILDIFGFEIFQTNGFEQLMINYANEMLQQHFNRLIFNLEQQEYEVELIKFDHVKFVDNQDCIDLIGGRQGILVMMNEEVSVPGGNDPSLLQKMLKRWGKNSACFSRAPKQPDAFLVKHHAGDVIYEIKGFVVKNKDEIHEGLLTVPRSSTNPLLEKIFKSKITKKHKRSINGPKHSLKSEKARTLSTKCQHQLKSLSAILKKTNQHYIRCIKPNEEKTHSKWDDAMVLEQLKFSGICEAVRIRGCGFPFRKSFSSFLKTYICCFPNSHPLKRTVVDESGERSTCLELVKYLQNNLRIDTLQIQVGKTKVFWKSAAMVILDRVRADALHHSLSVAQKVIRGFLARRLFIKMKELQRRAKEAIESREITNVRLALEYAREHSLDMFVVHELNDFFRLLISAVPVCAILKAATKIGMENATPVKEEADFIIAQEEDDKEVNAIKRALDTARKYLIVCENHTDVSMWVHLAEARLMEFDDRRIERRKLRRRHEQKQKRDDFLKRQNERNQRYIARKKGTSASNSPRAALKTQSEDIPKSPSRKPRNSQQKKEKLKEVVAIQQKQTKKKNDLYALSNPKFAFFEFKGLRTKAELLKGVSKKMHHKLLETWLVWQNQELRRSVVDFGTYFNQGIGHAWEKEKQLEIEALQIFRHIQVFMKDRYLMYASSLGHNILERGIQEPLLRDEIYCQLIKQTRRHPNKRNETKGWQLLHWCLNCFPPSSALGPFLTSHIALRILKCSKMDTTSHGKSQRISTLANMCLTQYYNIMASGTTSLPTIAEFEKINNNVSLNTRNKKRSNNTTWSKSCTKLSKKKNTNKIRIFIAKFIRNDISKKNPQKKKNRIQASEEELTQTH